MPKIFDYRRALLTIALLAGFLIGFLSVIAIRQPQYENSYEKAAEVKPDSNKQGGFGDWITRDASGFFTLVLCVVGGVQAALFVWQLGYMRRGLRDTAAAAKAAVESAQLARAAHVASHRAWIKINNVGPGILSYWEGKARMIASISIENIGNSPATNVNFFASILTKAPVNPFDTSEIIQEHERLCRIWKNENRPEALTVFPKERHPDRPNFKQGITGESEKQIEIPEDGSGVFFFFIGCVNYRFASDGNVTHQTPFIRTIEWPRGVLLPVGEMIYPDRLHFDMPNFLGAAQPD